MNIQLGNNGLLNPNPHLPTFGAEAEDTVRHIPLIVCCLLHQLWSTLRVTSESSSPFEFTCCLWQRFRADSLAMAASSASLSTLSSFSVPTLNLHTRNGTKSNLLFALQAPCHSFTGPEKCFAAEEAEKSSVVEGLFVQSLYFYPCILSCPSVIFETSQCCQYSSLHWAI